MKSETAGGIILRTRPLTETSLIVHWLTPELGRLATVAKGARRPKSPFAGKLDLFFAAEFSFQRSRRSELHTLREVKPGATHRALREDIGRLQQAAYAANFIEQTTETETPLPEIFALAKGFFQTLCAQNPAPQNVFALELKLLRELGLAPAAAEARLTPGAEKIAEILADAGWEEVSRLKLSPAQAGELDRWLHGFQLFHLGKPPRGRTAALAAGR